MPNQAVDLVGEASDRRRTKTVRQPLRFLF